MPQEIPEIFFQFHAQVRSIEVSRPDNDVFLNKTSTPIINCILLFCDKS